MAKIYSVDLYDYDEHGECGNFDNEEAAHALRQVMDDRINMGRSRYKKTHEVNERLVFSTLAEYLAWEKSQ